MLLDPNQVGGKAQAIVDFGFATGGEGDIASVVVPAPWARSSSIVICSVSTQTTPDHSGEDAVVEGLVAYPGDIVPGVQVTVHVSAPNGTWGRYAVNVHG